MYAPPKEELTLDRVLAAADRAHRETSGSGGCATYSCDEDNHAPSWHQRFIDRLRAHIEAAAQ